MSDRSVVRNFNPSTYSREAAQVILAYSPPETEVLHVKPAKSPAYALVRLRGLGDEIADEALHASGGEGLKAIDGMVFGGYKLEVRRREAIEKEIGPKEEKKSPKRRKRPNKKSKSSKPNNQDEANKQDKKTTKAKKDEQASTD